MLDLRRPFRFVAGVLSSGVVAAILLLLLVLDWMTLPNTPWARASLAPRSAWRGAAHGRPVNVELFRSPDGLRAVCFPEEIPAGWEHVGEFGLFRDMRRRSGAWGLTREQQVLHVTPGDLTPAELAQMPRVVLEAIEQSAESDMFVEDGTVALLRSPTFVVSRRLRGGYVHNAFACALASLLVVSLGLYTARLRRAAVERGRLQRGDCTRCGYPLAGGAACPECGEGQLRPWS
jgi:hypothetical protein